MTIYRRFSVRTRGQKDLWPYRFDLDFRMYELASKVAFDLQGIVKDDPDVEEQRINWDEPLTPALSQSFWFKIAHAVSGELGRSGPHRKTAKQYVVHSLQTERNYGVIMDIIEIVLRTVISHERELRIAPDLRFSEALIAAVNCRFDELDLPFTFERDGTTGLLTNQSNASLYTEFVEPVLGVLKKTGFHAPFGELQEALQAYLMGNYPEAIHGSCNAFESTLKSICDSREIDHNSIKSNSFALVELLIKRGIIPSYLKNHMTGLCNLRNAKGGHGRGPRDTPAVSYEADYAIRLCASNIRYLMQAHEYTPFSITRDTKGTLESA